MGGDLQAVEAAPGDAGHADGAVAPGLRRQRRDDLAGVGLFARQVFVLEEAVAVARAPQVHPAAGDAVARPPGMNVEVAEDRSVPPPIGDHLDHDRNRPFVHGAPERRGDARAVGQNDPMGIDHLDGKRKVAPDPVHAHLRVIGKAYNKRPEGSTTSVAAIGVPLVSCNFFIRGCPEFRRVRSASRLSNPCL